MPEPVKIMVRIRCSCWSRSYFQRYVVTLDHILPSLRQWIAKGCHDNPGHQLSIEVRQLEWRRSIKQERELRRLLQQ